jgi:hypothetical protein
MKLAKLTVDAGWHTRKWCPVTAEIALGADVNLDKLVLHDTLTNALIPVQAWRAESGKVGLAWIVELLGAKQKRVYELQTADAPVPVGVQLTEKAGGKLDVTIGGQYLTTYNYGPDVVRPYCYPFIGDAGLGMTRNWPMVKDVAGETNDHPHHKGLYTAQGEVNGIDNWGEGPNHAYIIHRSFSKVYSGPIAGGFVEELDWTDKDKKPVMTETRRVNFYLSPVSPRLLDWEVSLHASLGEIVLGDTKEGGLLSIRVPSTMDEQHPGGGGLITTSTGGISEAESWGKRAAWCDYSGPVGNTVQGVAIMDHDTNPRHPTYWHVRAYGLFTANCFGIHDFTRDPKNLHPYTIPAGSTSTWKYRVAFHTGSADAKALDVHYHDYINAPKVTVE